MLRMVISGLAAVSVGLIGGVLLMKPMKASRTTEVQISGPSRAATVRPIAQPPTPKHTADEPATPVVAPVPPPAPKGASTSPSKTDVKAPPAQPKAGAAKARRTKDAPVVAGREKQRTRTGRRRRGSDDC
jgi:hypothetical protein